jgi:nucleotide-binding universal stress UspA family protein
MFKNVLVGLKEGVNASPLLELATTAVPAPATLHLVSLIRIGTDENEVERLRATDARLEKHAASLRSLGYEVQCESGLIAVAAAADLLRTAERKGVDLVVIGLAKRSRVGKALMGSDAQRVLLGASCPVLVTRAQEA